MKWYQSIPRPTRYGSPLGDRDWGEYFGGCYVVNLDIASLRRNRFCGGMPWPWPLPPVERVEAVEGGKVGVPENWTAGPGAYGLYLTYIREVEAAIARGDTKPLIFFEDDCLFVPNFYDRFRERMRNVPADWDMLWIGGEHRNRTATVAPGVVRAFGPHRTHSFAIAPHFFETVLRIWRERFWHVDHAVTECAGHFKIFALDPFLTAQNTGESYIASGGFNSVPQAWHPETRRWFYDASPRPLLHAYVHVAQVGKWKAVLAEQVKAFEASGLPKHATVLFVVIGGEPIALPAWGRFIDGGDDLLRYEYATLELLDAHARREPDAFYFYSHLKGVTTGDAQWRRDCTDFTVDLWMERVMELDVRHTTGPKFCVKGPGYGSDNVFAHGHYSGNFWWARGDYLRTLPAVSSLDQRSRYWAEAWIGQSGKVNQLLR